MSTELKPLKKYEIEGAWIDEPWIKYAKEEMVLAADAEARERVLVEALKSVMADTPWSISKARVLVAKWEAQHES